MTTKPTSAMDESAEQIAERLLPCRYNCEFESASGEHEYDEEYAVCPAHYRPAVATALRAARERALEEAAVKCETLGFMVPIDELIGMTKKEMAVITCKEAAKAIRALAQKGGEKGGDAK